MSSVILSCIDEDFPITFNEDNKTEAIFLLYVWSLGLLETKDVYGIFRHHLEDLSYANYERFGEKPSAKADTEIRKWFQTTRKQLFESFDIIRLRLATIELAFIHQNKLSDNELRGFFIRKGLPGDSAILYRQLLQDDKWREVFINKMRTLTNKELFNDVCFDWRLLIAQCDEDFKKRKLNQAARAVARRKLTFVYTSNNLEYKDFAQDLVMRSAAYYYWCRPWKSRLHAVNYSKGALTSGSLQIIDYEKKPERARLIETPEGAISTVLSWDDKLSGYFSTEASLYEIPNKLPASMVS